MKQTRKTFQRGDADERDEMLEGRGSIPVKRRVTAEPVMDAMRSAPTALSRAEHWRCVLPSIQIGGTLTVKA